MDDLILIKAKPENLDAVESIFLRAVKDLNARGIPQWDELYPAREHLENDIRQEQMYLAVSNGIIAATVTVNAEYPPEYDNCVWMFTDLPFRVLHRLCVDPVCQHKGFGTKTMLMTEEMLRAEGVKSIRLDAFSLNPCSLRMYERLGYRNAGSAVWRMGQFYLYEKRIG